jgi:hypothetical protein
MVGTVIGTIAIVAVTIVLGVVVDRRGKLVPRPEELRDAARPPAARLAPGETAATAIRAGAIQLMRLRASQRCSACRSALVADPDDTASYEGAELLLLRFGCASCATRRTIYIDRI